MMFLLRSLLAQAALRKPWLSRVMAAAGHTLRASGALCAAALLLLAAPWAMAQNQVIFNYTGAAQTYTVPPGVWDIQIQVFGAGGGGGGSDNPGSGGAGGRGQGVSIIYPSGPDAVYTVVVGGGGSGGTTSVDCNTSGGVGGLAGGVGSLPGGKGGNRGCYGYSGAGGGGGAASAVIRPVGGPLLTAGGGGGGQGGSLNLPGRDGLTDYTPGSAYSNLGPITQFSGPMPVGSTFTYCAPQGGTCSFSGIKEVWYGSDEGRSGWAVLPASNSAPCSDGVLGEPNYGRVKACYYRDYTGSWTPSVTGGSEGTGGTGGSTGSGDGGGGGGGGGGCVVGTGGAANQEGASSNTTTQASGGRSCYVAGAPYNALGAVGGLGGAGGGPGFEQPGQPGAAGSVVITYPTLTLAKSQPSPALVVGADSVYTLTVTNTSSVAGLKARTARVVDQLPPNMTYVSSSGTGWSCSPAANAGGTLVTCNFDGTINANGGTAVLQITAKPTNHFTVTNYAAVDTIGSTSPPVPTTCTAANTPAGCAAPVVSPVPVTVNGYGYEDLNHNGARDAGEIGRTAGGAIYVKLTTRTGSVCNLPSPAVPALAVILVGQSPGSGAYSFPNVAQGDYCLLLQRSNSLTVDLPGYPSGHIGTENSTGVIQFTVGSGEVPLLNFGLYRGARLAGTVFADNGTGSGAANNGVKDGTEAGLAGVTVILAQNGTELARAVSSGDGRFVLWQPPLAVAPATITPMLPAGYTATGGSAGSLFAGSYTRPTANFSLASGRDVSDIAFGMVAPNTLAPNGAQAAQPGTAVFYAHTYTAATGGQVTFTLANAASPADSGWSQVIYQDSNCDAVLQASEPVITAPMAVTAGQKVCLIVKQYVAAGAEINAQNAVTLSAAFNYTNAAPALGISTLVATDITTVNQGGDLTLSKLVANLTQVTQYLTSVPARPGDELQYRLSATNMSAKPLSSLVVNDFTPAFTNFFSAACPFTLPAGITGCSVTKPAVGAKGAVQWTFTGSLEPGKSMLFFLRVNVDQ